MTSIIKVILVEVIALASIELSTLCIYRASKLVKIGTLIVGRNLFFGVVKLKVIVSHKTFKLCVWLGFLVIKALESC